MSFWLKKISLSGAHIKAVLSEHNMATGYTSNMQVFTLKFIMNLWEVWGIAVSVWPWTKKKKIWSFQKRSWPFGKSFMIKSLFRNSNLQLTCLSWSAQGPAGSQLCSEAFQVRLCRDPHSSSAVCVYFGVYSERRFQNNLISECVDFQRLYLRNIWCLANNSKL